MEVVGGRIEDLDLKLFGRMNTVPSTRHWSASLRRCTIMIALGPFILLLMTGLVPHRAQGGQVAPAIAGVWHLKFDDEFNGKQLDRTKWSTTYPWGGRTNGGNHELEYYTDTAFTLSSGVLRIQADRHSSHGFKYTSGMISSHASFNATSGYFEIRAKVPKGTGLWPAFWLAPVDMSWPPEIDIMEVQGNRVDTSLMANHYATAQGPRQTDVTWTGPDFSKTFHTFGMEWSAKQLTWYIDGVQRFYTSTHLPTKPMYLLVSFAVGGDWVGPPDSATPFPSYVQVDYIRAYQH